MSVTSGFFNSVSGDRLYNADQMSLYFEGLISQGVFENVGDRMQVTAGTGMSVNVGTGRAIVQSKWCKNDSALNLEISAADVQKNRIDAIAVRFDATARTVSIVVKEGTATTGTATSPERATGADVYELFLAYIDIPKNTLAITQDLITDLRASDMCGWVTGIIDQVDTSDLFTQWQTAYESYFAQSTAAFNAYLAQKQSEFDTWFSHLTQQLNVDTTLHAYQNSVTVSGTTNEVNIGISDYDSSADTLFAYTNGILLVLGSDYMVSGTGSSAKIVLLNALVGTNEVTFLVLKPVIGEGSAIGDIVLYQLDTSGGTIANSGVAKQGFFTDGYPNYMQIAQNGDVEITGYDSSVTFGAAIMPFGYSCPIEVEFEIHSIQKNYTWSSIFNNHLYWSSDSGGWIWTLAMTADSDPIMLTSSLGQTFDYASDSNDVWAQISPVENMTPENPGKFKFRWWYDANDADSKPYKVSMYINDRLYGTAKTNNSNVAAGALTGLFEHTNKPVIPLSIHSYKITAKYSESYT